MFIFTEFRFEDQHAFENIFQRQPVALSWEKSKYTFLGNFLTFLEDDKKTSLRWNVMSFAKYGAFVGTYVVSSVGTMYKVFTLIYLLNYPSVLSTVFRIVL